VISRSIARVRVRIQSDVDLRRDGVATRAHGVSSASNAVDVVARDDRSRTNDRVARRVTDRRR